MASVSLSPSAPFSTSTLGAPAMSTGHTRKHSRNPTASKLPAFTFNPGTEERGIENEPPVDDAMARPTSRRAAKPPPLPAFSFNPGAELHVEDRSSPTHPVLEEMVMNQQRMSRSAKPAPLPAFTLAPSSNTQLTPSPTKSEFGDISPVRPIAGHKRAGSEFVGGNNIEGPTLLSTSPSKHEAKPSASHLSAAGRRGHAHRRSQAVSISDIDTSDLIKAHAVAKHRTSSVHTSGPPTPSETVPTLYSEQDAPHTMQSISMRSPPSSPRRGSAPGGRPRVEFADKIDFIPRPLSMISSETEGSCSTARYSHSLSNSLNSIASPSRAASLVSSPVLEGSPKQRPNTADPALMLSSINNASDRPMTEVSLPKRPLSASGSPAVAGSGSPPIKKKHFWFSHSPEPSPTSTPRVERPDPMADLFRVAMVSSHDNTRPKTSPERSASQRRKYHTWTSGIFSKKSKVRMSKPKGRRTPTPPALQRQPSDKINQIFDTDNTVVLRSESPEVRRVQPMLNIAVVPTAPQMTPEEVCSPIIDLDAALGPSSGEEKLDHHARGSMSRIAKLHSSERRGNLDAFGTVHRRTESAPAMPAFNRSGFGLTRHGSNPSLAEEVFDEEEEDIFLAGQKKTLPLASLTKGDTQQLKPVSNLLPDSQKVDGLGLSHVSDPADAVVIVDPEQNPNIDDLRSSKSTLEAPMYDETDMTKRPVSSPMSFAYPSTQSHYASSTEGRTTTSASMISSPDPDHLHFDSIPRLTPSVAQQSPDFYLRPSNDDLPSLSDSISSGAVARISSSANTRSSVDQRQEQRSASMFVPGTSRPTSSWKRSSLASLNRLIPGSANGSKLKFETTSDIVLDEKTKKKTNRLSKLVNFWRPKDKSGKS